MRGNDCMDKLSVRPKRRYNLIQHIVVHFSIGTCLSLPHNTKKSVYKSGGALVRLLQKPRLSYRCREKSWPAIAIQSTGFEPAFTPKIAWQLFIQGSAQLILHRRCFLMLFKLVIHQFVFIRIKLKYNRTRLPPPLSHAEYKNKLDSCCHGFPFTGILRIF